VIIFLAIVCLGLNVQPPAFSAQLVDLGVDVAPGHNNLAEVMLEFGNREAAIKHTTAAVQLGGEYLPLIKQHLMPPHG
jgi:hypothetical protein